MREDLPGRPCSVAAALNLVGEKWALLAVREIAFGNKRFDVIARNTGAPRDRLAARLRALEAAGVIARRQYSEHPARYEYELTQAGRELREVLQALRVWGDKWAVETPPAVFDALLRARPGFRRHLPALRRGGRLRRPRTARARPGLDPRARGNVIPRPGGRGVLVVTSAPPFGN